MKINTKLFNEDFIAVAQNLPQLNGDGKYTLYFKESRTSATAKPTLRTKTKTFDAEEEDKRLDRIQKMQN
jgi:hypothetical protein